MAFCYVRRGGDSAARVTVANSAATVTPISHADTGNFAVWQIRPSSALHPCPENSDDETAIATTNPAIAVYSTTVAENQRGSFKGWR